ncbi:hypothetical protein CBR_g58816 [Chara braunii]|uniref:t-SNARE coiled-coil homology domain-containing protein n=1 Tax=Chara braunii TaxID=69332 RepID=A0A388K8E5_CHABU|nr:hypothetical protein CBR_g58816 [Chara braunii]|eukprot:GBG66325.1 hypothetical protein CBR_g58816 [Chara braunii]
MPVTLIPAPSASSSYRDRTAELFSLAERLKKTQGGLGDAGTSAAPPVVSQNGALREDGGGLPMGGTRTTASAPLLPAGGQTEFARKASQIGVSIHQTSQKLAKLAKLAKRTSMFDDPAVEIQELTAVIKQDITALNTAIANLQELSSSRESGTGQNRHTSEHSATVVDNLKSRLMSTTKEFKDVLTMRTENLKVHQNRRQLFSASSLATDAGPFGRTRAGSSGSSGIGGGATASLPWGNGASTSSATQLFSSTSRRRSGQDSLLPTQAPWGGASHQQQQQQMMVPAQDGYMASRAEALQNVESTIVELSSIFQQLATMVAEQGEMAVRIDENLEDTLANVEGAQGALLKYLSRISSNRWLVIKIFFVLIIFLLIFVVFVA